jgi:ubiquinone/menaquinone biosynthesis C-methylase UbiE
LSTQLQYLQSYSAMVRGYLAAYPEDEAMAWAVGGSLESFERFGVLEHSLLRMFGLRDDARVVDVGCGAGRLARQLARCTDMRYFGIDVVPELLDYTRRKVARPGFAFQLVAGNAIPVADGQADFVTFFSVITHLLHEESYAYLEQSRRVLAPGGRVVFSFLEFANPSHWAVFDGNVDWVRKRSYLGHINVFMHQADIRLWARRLGFEVVAIGAGDERTVRVTERTATEAVPPGEHPLGQSWCVLEKPRAG